MNWIRQAAGERHAAARRRLLGWLGVGLGALPMAPRAAPAGDAAIEQPAAADDRAFIERAFAMRARASALGDQPYGAVVVRDGIIIGQSWSRVVLDDDPTGHAEMAAMRDAGRRHGRQALAGATLYSSSHPCAMCEAAASWVGIRAMIHGRGARIAGPPRRCSG